jgi:hypothetical protein
LNHYLWLKLLVDTSDNYNCLTLMTFDVMGLINKNFYDCLAYMKGQLVANMSQVDKSIKKFVYQHLFIAWINTFSGLFQHKIKNQNKNWNLKLNESNLVLNYFELKMNFCNFSVDIWVGTIIALKQHYAHRWKISYRWKIYQSL